MAEQITLKFDIYKDGAHLQTVTLDETPIKIGKLPSSHLRIDDDDVSRIHAVIEPARDEGFHIIDLGSASGTFVNGAKVNKQKLSSGDEITLGATTVRVTLEKPRTPRRLPPWSRSRPQRHQLQRHRLQVRK